MSYLYFNRLVVTGQPEHVARLEQSFRRHSQAVAAGSDIGTLSEAFGECDFAPPDLIRARDEAGIGLFIAQCEDTDRAAVIRPYPEVLRVHFVTNWLMCHDEIKRIALQLPVLRFRLDWMSLEENTTGRLVVIGHDIECEAVMPMWQDCLYVMPGAALAGHWCGLHDQGDLAMFQQINQ